MLSTRGKQGFTLVELLVVIAILALLMAILLPALQRVRRQAKAAACQVNLRQWGTTLSLFAEDNEGRFPQDDLSTAWILTGRAFAEWEWGEDTSLEPPRQYHAVSTKGMLCPEATKPGDHPGRGGAGGGGGVSYNYEFNGGGTFRAWVLTEYAEDGSPLRVSYVSYGLNGWLFRPPGGSLIGTPPWERPPPSYTDVFSLRRRARIPLLLDCISHSGWPTDDGPPPRREEDEVLPRDDSSMRKFCRNRHTGHVNCLFLDWSVRKVGLKELWTLKWHPDFNTAGPWTKAGGVQPEDWPEWMRHFKDY